jgi:hypothetical protein
MSLPTVINYSLHSLKVQDSPVSGVQSLTFDETKNVTSISTWGNPFASTNLHKKPNVTVNFVKFIADTSQSLVLDSGVNRNTQTRQLGKQSGILPYQGINVSPIDIDITISPNPTSSSDMSTPSPTGTPVGIKCRDMVLNAISYKFSTDGYFTEECSFAGHSLESGVLKVGDAGYYQYNKKLEEGNFVPHSGTTKRRQNFFLAQAPREVSTLLASGAILRSVDVSINFEYGEYPTYGGFYTVANKYVKYPFDISCSFEVLDRGYLKYNNKAWEGLLPESGYLNIANAADGKVKTLNTVYRELNNESIQLGISGALTIDLGDNNYLTSSDRSGGEAGQSSYTVYKFTYKNSNNTFTIS